MQLWHNGAQPIARFLRDGILAVLLGTFRRLRGKGSPKQRRTPRCPARTIATLSGFRLVLCRPGSARGHCRLLPVRFSSACTAITYRCNYVLEMRVHCALRSIAAAVSEWNLLGQKQQKHEVVCAQSCPWPP